VRPSTVTARPHIYNERVLTAPDEAPGTLRGRPPSFALLAICFFLSGATGLVYEVVWLRLLGLVFGHSVYAITTVLAAFMAGLGLGSVLLAGRVGRIRNLIAAYGWLEIGIGAYCALMPGLLWLAAGAYLGLHRMLGLSPTAFGLVQFAIVFSLLLVPTTLMGGTLPVLSQALARSETGLGRTIGALYAVNTLGALVGVALAGYVVIPALGNRISIAVAAMANLAVGCAALAYARGRRGATVVRAPGSGVPPKQADPPPLAGDTPRAAAWGTVAALGLSGAVSMIYEVAWTRALALVIGSSTYAFTAMLISFLLGIAGGSALYSWLWGKRAASPATFAALQVAIALAAAMTLVLFERLPAVFLSGLGWSDSPGFVQLLQVVVSVIALLPATLAIGATFPCAVAAVAGPAERAGRTVGYVYAVNTLGAIAGTVLAGFLLIPTWGIHSSLKVGILGNLLSAAALLLIPAGGDPRWWRWRVAALGGTLAVALVVSLVPPWDQRVMASGPAIYGKRYLREAGSRALTPVLRDGQFLYSRDGPSATVHVYRVGKDTFLRVNGKTDASTAGDMPTQLVLGHLPLLLHREPRRVLVIGLGSGITAGAVARHPVERIDIAEIEPAVVEGARFFAHVHGDVLRDPRVRTVVADGRNHLLTASDRYDVIISEPSNPWIGGLASLFSVEFFQLARERLQPDGVMLQWLQGYNLASDDMRMIVRTFRTAFPATTVWHSVGGDFLLLGATRPLAVDLSRIRARYDATPGLRKDLERLGHASWSGILGYFVLGEADTERFARGEGGLNTDNRLPLEFSAPRALYLDTTERNSRLVRSFRTADLPDITPESRGELDRAEVAYAIAMGHVRRNAGADALPHLLRALERDPAHLQAMLRAGDIYLRLRRPAEALQLARRALDRAPNSASALLLAGLASERLRAPKEAVAYLERAVLAAPQDPRLRQALTRAQLAELRGDASSAADEDLLAGLLTR